MLDYAKNVFQLSQGENNLTPCCVGTAFITDVLRLNIAYGKYFEKKLPIVHGLNTLSSFSIKDFKDVMTEDNNLRKFRRKSSTSVSEVAGGRNVWQVACYIAWRHKTWNCVILILWERNITYTHVSINVRNFFFRLLWNLKNDYFLRSKFVSENIYLIILNAWEINLLPRALFLTKNHSVELCGNRNYKRVFAKLKKKVTIFSPCFQIWRRNENSCRRHQSPTLV